MAFRPIFVCEQTTDSFIYETNLEFKWFPGMAITKKQKSIESLHRSAEAKGLVPILEISTKSKYPLGIKLSAFNLKLKIEGKILTTVEAAYQGSKVFKKGGHYNDLYYKTSREAKKDERLYSSGELIGFEFETIKWDLTPDTAFYDWLYINALVQNEELSNEIMRFNAFTDIEYNPKKQVSCQARSAAYFVSLTRLNLLRDFITSKEDFIELYKQNPNKRNQYSLDF